jgi:predicted PurR-regulated permease PerM
VATVAVFVVPVAVEQLQSVTGQAGILADQFNHTIRSGALFDLLARFGVSVEKAKETLLEYVTPKVEELLKQLFEALFGVVASLTSVVHQILNIIIIPFVLFYLLMDFPRVTHQCAMLVPKHSRDHYTRLTGLTDQLMGRYFRGAILVALIQGTISGLSLWLIGVDYALVLGIMTSVLNFVPYVGLAVSLMVASIVALLSGGAVWMKVLFVAILYFGQKLLEATVLGPKIIGPQVGLHPVLLILCLMVFGYFLGFVGLLIAVPATALIIAAVKDWEAVRTQHRAPAA